MQLLQHWCSFCNTGAGGQYWCGPSRCLRLEVADRERWPRQEEREGSEWACLEQKKYTCAVRLPVCVQVRQNMQGVSAYGIQQP